jgi:hypothetical protein
MVTELGPLSAILKGIKKQPYSYALNESEATKAALGNDIYVIEVVVEARKRIYRLGYRYRAYECFVRPGGTPWSSHFKYKNTIKHGLPAEGMYFDSPILIQDQEFTEWCKREPSAMLELPAKYIDVLEGIFSLAVNGAHSFQ